MRLTIRLTLATAWLMGLVLMVSAVLSVQREGALIESDVERDVQLVAVALAHAGSPDQVPGGVNGILSDVRVEPIRTWLRLGLEELPAPLDEAARERLAGGRPTTFRANDARGQPWLHAVAPRVGAPGYVEVAESLAIRDAYVQRVLWDNVLIVVLTTLIGALAALAYGRSMVGRRVDQLVDHAAELGRGEFSHVVEITGSDELSSLAAALNHLGRELETSTNKLKAESNARLIAQREADHTDRLRLVGRVAAGLAHEIGTPLAVISGRAQILQRRLSDDKALHNVAVIREQTEVVSELVRLLLNQARESSGELEELDVAQVVQHVITLVEPMAKRYGIEVAVALPGAPVVARLERTGLIQALSNLMVNAIQAAGQGGQVGIEVSRDGEAVVATLDDSGPGIPAAMRQRVLEPFFTTKGPSEGTGLGLAIVSRFVERHGGTLHIGRGPLGGARFGIRLPAADDQGACA